MMEGGRQCGGLEGITDSSGGKWPEPDFNLLYVEAKDHRLVGDSISDNDGDRIS